ncbi:hypothetical protein [Streptomyces lunalinharesii]|uniref:Integral membrane protein n=1 Tax=Streptomyces lunalinharesii TaxID=333384 RepID=A0ABP6EJ24_9ACTN
MMTMATTAAVLRWGFLIAGVCVLLAFSVTAVRRWRGGSRFGELTDVMEREWFSAGKVFFAVLAGAAGSWAAAYVGGTRSPLIETVPIVFPLGLVAAFVVCRYAGRGGNPLRVKALALLLAPLALGTVMTGW